MQLDPKTYNRGMIGGFRQVIQNEGASALLTGAGATFSGYFIQGAFKFGGYEFFKKKSVEAIGMESARQNRLAVYSVSAASAEFFASVALCPLEATRIRLVSDKQFASGLVSGFTKILKTEGLGGFYSGFGPILFKQYVQINKRGLAMSKLTGINRVPYTVTKFAAFEKISEIAFARLDKSSLSDGAVTGVNLGCGLLAGFAAAIVSQPADTMLSKINKTKGLPGEGTVSRLMKIAGELGFRGSFAGLPTRLFMVGGLTAGQFAIYGDIKKALGMCLYISHPLLLELTTVQEPLVVPRLRSRGLEDECMRKELIRGDDRDTVAVGIVRNRPWRESTKIVGQFPGRGRPTRDMDVQFRPDVTKDLEHNSHAPDLVILNIVKSARHIIEQFPVRIRDR